ncbi:MAG: DJ-1/PfpI family protein [Ruminococcaceae bacterium]|nr:DJ-1/PfpI family protein [Oscillospiraceae bacterium]
MVYVFLADGFEEVEALAPVDILRRAGIEVLTVGVTGKNVVGAHNITVTADITCNELETANLQGVVLPGGMPGTLNLEKDEAVQRFIDIASKDNILLAAICAAPSILGHKGLLKNKKATCFPGFEKELIGAAVTNDCVVRDGNIITGRGAGAALEFGLQLVAYFKDAETAEKLRKSMCCV